MLLQTFRVRGQHSCHLWTKQPVWEGLACTLLPVRRKDCNFQGLPYGHSEGFGAVRAQAPSASLSAVNVYKRSSSASYLTIQQSLNVREVVLLGEYAQAALIGEAQAPRLRCDSLACLPWPTVTSCPSYFLRQGAAVFLPIFADSSRPSACTSKPCELVGPPAHSPVFHSCCIA